MSRVSLPYGAPWQTPLHGQLSLPFLDALLAPLGRLQVFEQQTSVTLSAMKVFKEGSKLSPREKL